VISRYEVEQRLREAGLQGIWEGTPPPGFEALRLDSRTVEPGDLFCAISGTRFDGHSFLDRVAAAGAAAAIVKFAGDASGIPRFVVPDTRIAAAHLSQLFAGDPVRELEVIGVTGTNGKTTTAVLLRHLLAARAPAAALGTLGVLRADGRTTGGRLTTPDPLDLAAACAELVSEGTQIVVMEVSSHALDQHRVDAIAFSIAVFTNLTRDHLDYHRDMDAYRTAKLRLARLLKSGGICVVNGDEPAWSEADFGGADVIRYGTRLDADVRAEDVRVEATGSEWSLVTPDGRAGVRLPLLGMFNVANALAAAAAAWADGLDTEIIARELSAAPRIPGRMETLATQPALVVRDYAHTPDALARALEALRPSVPGRLIVVFGCGGDRDSGKRTLMGQIGVRGSDYALITSDNPRTEDPESIIHDTVSDLEPGDWDTIVDRQSAIQQALSIAAAGDAVLLAGKGHESYQEVDGERQPFDEAEIVRSLLVPARSDQ
jgi:UDP-N-acetylmuramoyl-L-alanyl-D-glutamate--2,6-diaminopimelate ligase